MAVTYDAIMIVSGFPESWFSETLQRIKSAGTPKRFALIPASRDVLGMETSEVLKLPRSGKEFAPKDTSSAPQAILIDAGGNKKGVKWVERFKKNCPETADCAFAIITSTGKSWSVEKYIKEVTAEHKFMKNHKVADNPDFKPV